MNKYWKYFKYVMEHKKNVASECIAMSKTLKGKDKFDILVHAFTHDLSKLLPNEFIPYARYFYGNYISEAVLNSVPYFEGKSNVLTKEDITDTFNVAWINHYKRNKHHWNHWCYDWDIHKKHMELYNKPLPMPIKYRRQMICDWKAMAKKFGDTAQEFYLKNYHKIELDRQTRFKLEYELDLITHFNAPICECNEEAWMTIDELIASSETYYREHGTIAKGSVKENINDLLKPACDKYNVDIYELVRRKE